MATTPITSFTLYQVPFDPTYKNLTTFTDGTQRANYLATLPHTATYTNAQYIRRDDTYNVPMKFDDVEPYNYIVYNNNEGLGLEYAFIIEKKFLSFDVTELTLKIDVWQNNIFNVSFNSAFVEKAHITRFDSNGKPLYDEIRTPEASPTARYLKSTQDYKQLNNILWAVLVFDTPADVVQDRASSALSCYSEVYIPFDPYETDRIFAPVNSDGSFGTPFTHISKLLENAEYSSMLGLYVSAFVPFDITVYQEGTTTTYLAVPSSGTSHPIVWETPTGGTLFGNFIIRGIALEQPNTSPFHVSKTIYIEGTTTNIEGLATATQNKASNQPEFEPKLRTSPMEYYEVNVGSQRLQFGNEDIDGTVKAEIYPAVGLGAVGVAVSVTGTKLDPFGQKNRLSHVSNATLGLRTDAYKEYMRNNSTQLVYANALKGATAISGGMTGNAKDVVSGVSGIAGTAVDLMQLAQRQDTPRGSSFSALQSIVDLEEGNKVRVFRWGINDNEKAVMFNRFNRYGYTVDKVIALTWLWLRSRYWFNFVKTVGASFAGVGCVSERIQLQAIFDSGVTLWHCNGTTVLPYGSYNVANCERNLM